MRGGGRASRVEGPAFAKATAGRRGARGQTRQALAWLGVVWLAGGAAAFGADGRLPHIGYVYPAGAQAGTSVVLKVGGEYIYGTTAALLSATDVTVTVVSAADPLAGQTTGNNKPKRRKNQTVIDEVVTLKATVAPNAAAGDRCLRLVAPGGLSNPLLFQVGRTKEAQEAEPNNRKGAANALPALPVVANGQIQSGDLDTFAFAARKGQHLVIEVAARALMPYLADAVPGWFQAVIALSDAQGREVAYADDYRFGPDPVMFYDVAADGEYRLAIRDAIWRGRADFVYRIRIGEQPFIASVFPLGAPRGARPAPVRLTGRNLAAGTLNVDVNRAAPCVVPLAASRDGLASAPVPFAIGDLPEAAEDAAAARPDGQPVMPPVVINGRIATPGERDAYRFDGRKGQRVALAVQARRLGSPLDSSLALRDAHGRKIGENDDVKDRGQGWLTHAADSELTCELPEDGAYAVEIRDTQGKGGEDYAYRLRIAPPAPDFELRATPSSLTLPRGGSAALTVHAIRREGFTNEIRLALDEGSAPGCTLEGGVIPAGADKVRATLSASERAKPAFLHPRLRGTATVRGTPVTRPAVPAEDLMQAFAYQHLVPVDDAVLDVTKEPAPFHVTPQLGPQGALDLPAGKETSFRVWVTRRPGFEGPIRLELVDPPKGITLRKPGIPPYRDSAFITVRVETNVAAHLRENLILTGLMLLDKGGGWSGFATNRPGAVAAAATNAVAVAAGSATNAAKAGVGGAGRFADKERFVVALPALPIRVVDNPDRRKADADASRQK